MGGIGLVEDVGVGGIGCFRADVVCFHPCLYLVYQGAMTAVAKATAVRKARMVIFVVF